MAHPLRFDIITVVISLLLHDMSCHYQQQTFYIKPTNSSNCPANVSSFYCRDLSSFVMESHQLLSLNTSLLFLPGRHLLTSTLYIRNIKQFTMAADQSKKGTIVLITCSYGSWYNSSKRIHFESVSFVRIDSISFHSCGDGYKYRHGALLLRSVQESVIANSRWSESRGSAIVIEKSSTTIDNCQVMHTKCVICSGCGIRANQSNVIFTGHCKIQKNICHFGNGGGMSFVDSQLHLNGNLALIDNTAQNKGGGTYILRGSLSSTNHSIFIIAENVGHYGGGLFLDSVSVDLAGSLSCTSNTGSIDGGGIHMQNSSCYITGNVLVENNKARWRGGGLYVNSGSVQMTNATFSHNNAGEGGALLLWKTYFTILSVAHFSNNTVDRNGGAIEVTYSNIKLFGNTVFISNSATWSGGAIYAGLHVVVSFLNPGAVKFTENHASHYYGGGLYVGNKCVLTFKQSVRFTHNSAREGGALYLAVYDSIGVFQNEAIFTHNQAWHAGGSVRGNEQSSISFYSFINMTGNQANWAGGGIALTVSYMVITGNMLMEGNEAGSFGGAMFAKSSNIIFKGGSLTSKNKAKYGGALHAVDSNLDFSGSHSFLYNSGQFGGGWSLVGSASLTCSSISNITFDSNYVSQYGGAIWIDDISSNRCIKYSRYPVRKCFFQVDSFMFYRCRLKPINNTAILAGSIVYGGSVDNCYSYYDPFLPQISSNNQRSGAVFDKNVMVYSVNESTLSSPVSSDPTRVCFCQQDNKPNCSISHISIKVFSGEQFGLSLVAVGQRNGIVPAVILAHSDPPSNQSVQTAGVKCSMLYYTLSTAVSHVKLILHPESICNDDSNAVSVSTYIKPCPPGFKQDEDTKSCTCETIVEQLEIECDINSQSFVHEHGVWIGFNQVNISHSTETSFTILHHLHCPFNYCSDRVVNFTRNTTDEQCTHGRQGLLCGACGAGYSLTLGGSRCTPCSYHYLLLLLVFAVAGVTLVVFLLTLGLTVSSGTLNGLIFFANIVGTNSTVFIPPDGASFLGVFVAWLNLDLGVHTCLFPGLDMYAKVWLQFAFPLYVWALIGVIIVSSNRSVHVTRLLGGDPVSVLATLILLSYTKLLRTILIALSFTYLRVSDGSASIIVWLYDGNVQYASGKHIPLFLLALLVFLLLFIPYTSVLLVSPYLQHYSRNAFLSWIDNRRLKHFLRSYHAPLKDKRRSWIGLLLAVRFSLLLVFLANSLGDPGINLLTISITTFLIVSFKTLCGTVYTNWCLDALDLFFEVKLGLFSVSTLYIMKVKGNQSALSNTFLSVSFLVFSAIVLYHVQRRVVGSRLWKYSLKLKLKKCLSRDEDDGATAEGGDGCDQCQGQNIPRIAEVPITFIELREPLLDSAGT